MILGHVASARWPARRSFLYPSELGSLRRGFLQAGAAAGGGLMLSLSLPIASGEAEAARAGVFAPNAFIRIGGDGQIVLTMPWMSRWARAITPRSRC